MNGKNCVQIKTDGKIELVEDLTRIDHKKIMGTVMSANKISKHCFGLLSLMSNYSKCQLGTLNAKKFDERINSAENLKKFH